MKLDITVWNLGTKRVHCVACIAEKLLAPATMTSNERVQASAWISQNLCDDDVRSFFWGMTNEDTEVCDLIVNRIRSVIEDLPSFKEANG